MTSNGSPAIEVRGLAKRFGEVRAVAGIDFDVREGEVFGFLGPNGAGKTTTINMLTGLARPNAGTMRIAGIDCSKNPKAAQHLMGIVPDESNLWPDLDGFENLAFCGALYGMARREREERARELLGTFGLADASKRKFGGYSKGMKRKLAIVFRIADRYGFQNKAITVVTDERGGMYNLSLRVHLPEAPAIAPTFVHWRVGQQAVAQTVAIRLKADSPFKEVKLAGKGSGATEKFKAVVQALSEDPGGSRCYQVTVTPTDTAQAASATFELEFIAEGGAKRVFRLFARVLVKTAAPPAKSTSPAPASSLSAPEPVKGEGF